MKGVESKLGLGMYSPDALVDSPWQQGVNPDRKLIRHWEVEIKAWEDTIKNLERRLKKGKRHD